jgi:hypothetical protein
VLPALVLLVLPWDGGIRLATDVVWSLDISGEPVVVDEVRCGRVRKVRVSGLEASNQVQMGHPV